MEYLHRSIPHVRHSSSIAVVELVRRHSVLANPSLAFCCLYLGHVHEVYRVGISEGESLCCTLLLYMYACKFNKKVCICLVQANPLLLLAHLSLRKKTFDLQRTADIAQGLSPMMA